MRLTSNRRTRAKLEDRDSVGRLVRPRLAADCMGTAVMPLKAAALGRQLLSVAPMMDWTDLHYRQMARLISKRTWLWTEMVVDKTIIHTPHIERFLWFPPEQRPIVCQLGGSDPETLAAATRKVVEYGYDQINLNCGCPSDRVAGAGCFGASLMLEAETVARCMAAMAEAAQGTPVTVKCRLGVDQADSYDAMRHFIKVVSEGSPVTHFIIHARKCFLKGLNPHQNRTIPPLRYEWVYGLKRDFPHLQFSLNGGIQGCYEAQAYITHTGPFPEESSQPQDAQATPSTSTSQHAAQVTQEQDASLDQRTALQERSASHASASASHNGTSHLNGTTHSSNGCGTSGNGAHASALSIEGVMIGRQAYNDPWGVLADADRAVFGETSNPAASRRQVLQQYSAYAAGMQGKWFVREDGHQEPNVRGMMKPILNLFHGEKGSKKWKNAVDGLLKANPVSVEWVLAQSLHHIPDEVLDAPPPNGPCAQATVFDKASITPPAPIQMGRLPRSGDRAGFNQEPDGVDTKRGRGGAAGGTHGAAPAIKQPTVVRSADGTETYVLSTVMPLTSQLQQVAEIA